MIPLTSEQITARRVELNLVEDQLRTLRRRRATLRAEILSGYAQPEKTAAWQLSLPVEGPPPLKNEKAPAKEPVVLGDMTMTQVRQAILAEIGTWKRWHSGAAADQALWDELRRTGHNEDEDGSSFDVARAIDDVGMQALTALATEGKIQCSEKPGNWGNLYAPLGVSRAAEGGPEEPKPSRQPAVKKGKVQPNTATQPAPKAPARALGDVIEETLWDWKTWFIEEQLRAKVMEAIPLGAQLSERGWKETLSEMLRQGRLERCEENGHTLYRVPRSPPLPARKAGPSGRRGRHGHEHQATPSRQLADPRRGGHHG